MDRAEWKQAFGAHLRALREQVGMSQSQFAARADVSLDAVQNWEQGRTTPAAQTLTALADALGVSTDVLLRPKPSEESARGRGRPKKEQTPPPEPKPRSRRRKGDATP